MRPRVPDGPGAHEFLCGVPYAKIVYTEVQPVTKGKTPVMDPQGWGSAQFSVLASSSERVYLEQGGGSHFIKYLLDEIAKRMFGRKHLTHLGLKPLASGNKKRT